MKAGYQPVISPHIAKIELFEQSGHWQNYQDSMFPALGEYALKPMNCPFHVQMYAHKRRSYRELPFRLCEFGQVYRNEQSGALNGLFRARSFAQDDAHIFLAPEQLENELQNLADLFMDIYQGLGLNNFKARLSLRGEGSKYIGGEEIWQKSEAALRNALINANINFFEAEGEAAFYGPKIDFIFNDNLGRDWQLGTIQLDYNLPQRFNLSYIDNQCNQQQPIMIHRAPIGSIERLIAILLEYSQGKLPFWLAPEQIRILPISSEMYNYAEEILNQLSSAGVRAEIDYSGERLGSMIRSAKLAKIPAIAVIGKQELANKSINLNINNESISIKNEELLQVLKNQ